MNDTLPDKKIKYIPICEEDIINLQCAEKRLFDTLTPDYEALEIFTIRGIIKLYNEQSEDNKPIMDEIKKKCIDGKWYTKEEYIEAVLQEMRFILDDGTPCDSPTCLTDDKCKLCGRIKGVRNETLLNR